MQILIVWKSDYICCASRSVYLKGKFIIGQLFQVDVSKKGELRPLPQKL